MLRISARVSTLAVSLVACSAYAQQQSSLFSGSHAVEAYVSDEAIQVQYFQDLNVDELGETELAGGVLFNEDRDLVLTVTGLSAIGRADDLRRFTIHGGTRVFASFLHTEDEDVLGISLGGDARYVFGADRGNSILLSVYWAPDILVFGSSDGVADVSVRFETGLGGDTSIFVGYRVLEFDLMEDRRVDDSIHIGARYRF